MTTKIQTILFAIYTSLIVSMLINTIMINSYYDGCDVPKTSNSSYYLSKATDDNNDLAYVYSAYWVTLCICAIIYFVLKSLKLTVSNNLEQEGGCCECDIDSSTQLAFLIALIPFMYVFCASFEQLYNVGINGDDIDIIDSQDIEFCKCIDGHVWEIIVLLVTFFVGVLLTGLGGACCYSEGMVVKMVGAIFFLPGVYYMGASFGGIIYVRILDSIERIESIDFDKLFELNINTWIVDILSIRNVSFILLYFSGIGPMLNAFGCCYLCYRCKYCLSTLICCSSSTSDKTTANMYA